MQSFLLFLCTVIVTLNSFSIQVVTNKAHSGTNIRRIIQSLKASSSSSLKDNEFILETSSPNQLKSLLFKIAAISNRGETSSENDKLEVEKYISRLEELNPTENTVESEMINGEWELLYSNTNLFRSSPFFMASRAICKEGKQADRFNRFCDLHRSALAHTSIGKVKQIISPGLLTSEFETVGSVVPGLPIVVKGTIKSVAEIVSSSANDWTLQMVSTRIKEGTSNIPLFKRVLNSQRVKLPVQRLGKALERIPIYNTPFPIFTTSYLDFDLRISRDQDNHIFVYTRVVV